MDDNTVFKMTPGGALTSLVSFGGTNGANPWSGLALGVDHNLYGTTYRGGIQDRGTVFKMSPAGLLTTLVKLQGTNGAAPLAGLTLGDDGDFYGTTINTVFKVTTNGILTTLCQFAGTNGNYSKSRLVSGPDGNFYGTTDTGGILNGKGTVFKVTPTGTFTTLFVFRGTNGSYPNGGLALGDDGQLYGTTRDGGARDLGTVFRLRLPKPPATPPSVTTLAASDITASGATLNASLNPMGTQTLAWFEYGLTAAYGDRTDALPVGNSSNVVAFNQAVTALLAGTNHHHRIVATNTGGLTLGADLVFQTATAISPPTISADELLGTGQFRLRFDSSPGASFSVLVSGNLSDWNPLGPAAEVTPGHFEFTDAEAPGHSTRFYRLKAP